MTPLAKTVSDLVLNGKYVIGFHAAERLEQRGILEWQVVDAMERGSYLTERPYSEPLPTVEFNVLLPDGTPVKAVWGYMRNSQVAKLVTVHYLDD